VRWVDGAPFGRAGHLVATRPGRPGARKVVLIGHLDTVFEKDSPFQRYEALAGDPPLAKGPGTTDMKGGDVILIQALAALGSERLLDGLDLRVVLMGDEEDSGSPLALARADLLAAADGADVALGFEDGDGKFEHAVIARRSSSGWTLRVKGRPAHSSQIFREGYGDGAIFELARILDGFRRELSAEANLTFNPGVVLGGTTVDLDRVALRGSVSGKDNVIAADAVATGDLRTLAPEQHAAVKDEDAGDRRRPSAGDLGRDRVRRRLSADGADRRQSQLPGDVRPGEPRPRHGAVEAVEPRKAGAADILLRRHARRQWRSTPLGPQGHRRSTRRTRPPSSRRSASRRSVSPVLLARLAEQR
jgi:glutamate carboxypeptidase